MKRVQKAVMLSALMTSLSGLNLVISSSRVMSRMAGHSSFFRPKNSRMRWLSSTSLSMKMNRIWGRRERERDPGGELSFLFVFFTLLECC